MPVGQPVYFEGNILSLDKNSGYNLFNKPYGFFEVEVIAPEYIKIPILQIRFKINNVVRTIAPIGT